jgi:hypothetical protein
MALCANTIRLKARQKSRFDSIQNLIEYNHGYYFLRLAAPTEENCLCYQSKKIVQFTYLLSEAISITNQAQYFEIDASFRAIAPYVFTIPFALINNNSYPLGLQLSPSESEEHYNCFFKYLIYESQNPHILHNKAFLSDMDQDPLFQRLFEDYYLHPLYKNMMQNWDKPFLI